MPLHRLLLLPYIFNTQLRCHLLQADFPDACPHRVCAGALSAIPSTSCCSVGLSYSFFFLPPTRITVYPTTHPTFSLPHHHSEGRNYASHFMWQCLARGRYVEPGSISIHVHTYSVCVCVCVKIIVAYHIFNLFSWVTVPCVHCSRL